MSDASFPILDPELVGQLAADLGLDELRNIVTIFEGDVEVLSRALLTAAGSIDLDAFRRTAHRIAGAAGAVGAVALEQAARTAMQRTTTSGMGLAAAEMGRLGERSLESLHYFIRDAEQLG